MDSDTLGHLSQFGFFVTAAVALGVYLSSRRDTAKARAKETRARLSEMYFRFHSEILRSELHIDAARKLFFSNYTKEQTKLILMMYMLLNVCHMEWHFALHYKHPKKAFQATLDGFVHKMANQPQEHQFIIDDFDDLFADFPQDFRAVVKESLKPA